MIYSAYMTWKGAAAILISDVRKALDQYKLDDMKRLAMALYKAMPAKLRDEKNIDAMMKDLKAFEAAKKESAQGSAAPLNIKAMSIEITQFLDFAYAQYFLVPNTYVRKAERPKWRFRARDYIKQLRLTAPETEEGKTATALLAKLYAMLSYACAYYLFNTDNPFRSVGIEQDNLLDTVIFRLLANGVNADNLSLVIRMIVDGYVDRDTLTMDLIRVLVNRIRTTDGRETAIAQCKRIWEEKAAVGKPVGKRGSSSSDFGEYKKQEAMNGLVKMTFCFYGELYEFDSGIDYFIKCYKERDTEVTLYVLLGLLRMYKQPALWIREYERAQKQNVKLRDRLKAVYEQLLKTGGFDSDDGVAVPCVAVPSTPYPAASGAERTFRDGSL